MIVDRLSTRYDYHASLSRLQRDKNMGEFGDERQIADVVIFHCCPPVSTDFRPQLLSSMHEASAVRYRYI